MGVQASATQLRGELANKMRGRVCVPQAGLAATDRLRDRRGKAETTTDAVRGLVNKAPLLANPSVSGPLNDPENR